uniref:prolyl 4-hydroxylase subunit alpha-2-like n=1 Tax=Styela clava TaxID=7725 RepID=UPI00193A26BD|nr:prolyl 4-hydroxylase subunit alpha-2-like [Styela clava]
MYSSLAIIFIFSQVGHGHLHSAVEEMENLMREELGFIKNCKEYIASREEKLARVKVIVDSLNAEAGEAIVDAQQYLGHPVNQYLLLKRLITEFELITDLTDKNLTFADNLSKFRTNLPDREDIKESAKELIRSQGWKDKSMEDFVVISKLDGPRSKLGRTHGKGDEGDAVEKVYYSNWSSKLEHKDS